MVTLPPEFIATKYPGYFWNSTDQGLYSVKVTGVLTPLARRGPTFFTKYKTGWQVSVNGQRRWLDFTDLVKLKPKNTIYPVKQP